MGVAISGIVDGERIELSSLAHRVIAVDAFNMLYQFLTTIRMRDGTPLTNSKGETTSHLVGLFSRTANLLESQLRLVFVFDGETPALKRGEQDRRRALKDDAKARHTEAVAREDVESMRKYAGRTATLTAQMIAESKDLLDALGVPWVQAPAEAEAQAAHMVRRGDAEFVGSQDYDSLLFGAPRMLKNLSITGKRKRPGTSSYYVVYPEIITLQTELDRLGLTQRQLVALGMLVGTDFNPGGVKGLGPKKSLKLVQEHGEDLEALFAEAKWSEHSELAWQEVFSVLTEMPVSDDYTIEWGRADAEKLRTLLVERCEFSEERVAGTLGKLTAASKQKGLGEFF